MRLPASNTPDSPRFVVPSKPWYRTLGENLRALLAPPKMAPLRLSSQPVCVRQLWNKNEALRRAQALSLLTHSLAALLLALPVYRAVVNAPPGFDPHRFEKLIFPRGGGGGGGGERNPIPATAGKPARFEWMPRTPPGPIRNANPKLPEESALQGPPEIAVPHVPLLNFGDPSAPSLTNSAGPGGGNGYGTGCCGGDGPGPGRGLGPGEKWGTGEGEPGVWRKGTSPPECIYCPNPAFSEEARKAKLQGSVLLRLVVTPEGRAGRVRVAKGLGFGLDETAIEAVRAWRFKPARDPSGKFIPMWVSVEVTFRLL